MTVPRFAPTRATIILLIGVLVFSPVAPAGAAATLDTSGIDAALGYAGKMMPGDVYRVGLPRNDLHVTVDGVQISTPLALGGYAVYRNEPNGTLLMGDIPLLQSEVGPVQNRLTSAGFQITALHNHLLRDQPHIMYMHYMKVGDAVTMSGELHAALQATTMRPSKRPAVAPKPFPYGAAIDGALELKGLSHDGIYSVGLARPENVSVDGMLLPPAMGVGTSINFQAVDPDRIATTGDFVLIADQVEPVERALRAHGIEMTALHQHLVGGDPMLYFMHFWGLDSPDRILPGLRAAIDIVRPKS
mgnify:CR=1 FL=1